MELRRVSVITTLEAEEAVGEILFDVFQTASATWHNLETKESTISVYAELNRETLLGRKRALRERLGKLKGFGLESGSLKVSARKVKPEDWSESWKRHFRPIEIDNRVLIKPSWSRRKPKPGAAVVILDPGMSFGTGQHPTTSFCLEQLVKERKPTEKQSLLDIGTGTGVLAIAAEKIGYQPVHGFDFDPVAVRVAKENAAANRCSVSVFEEQDLLNSPVHSKAKYNVVCANLIYDVLLAGQTRILKRLRAGGTLILAGILTTQFTRIVKSYESSGLRLIQKRIEGDWTSGAFRFDV